MWGFASLGSFEFGAYLGLDIYSEYKYVVCLLVFLVDSVLKRSLVIVYWTSLLLWGHSEGV